MRRYVFLLSFLVVGNGIANGYDYGYDYGYSRTKELSNIEQYRIGYTDGYEEGLQKGMQEGYRMAIEDFKKIYQEKLKEYEEIEAGKLLIKEQRISYPRVYTIGGQSARLVVEGCKIIRPVDDLLAKIPQREFEVSQRSEDEELKPIRLKPYIKVQYCGREEELRKRNVVYYRKESDGCYIGYFEEERSLEGLCEVGRCVR
ncbi:MAG: hypothetical protein QXU09_02515 [Thermoproteota archaeon]